MKDILDIIILFGVGSIFGLAVGFYIILNKKKDLKNKEKMYKDNSNEKDLNVE